jgi:nucleoside-diphosphate-sugar epimerase
VKVFVTGATGVLGRASVAALIDKGHEVWGIARGHDKAAELDAMGATPVVTVPFFDLDAMTDAMTGFDAVCNLVTKVPVGAAGMLPRAWKANDRLRTEGSKVVAQAAREAGVRRLVQESVSFMYADGGDEWITEDSELSVTRTVEPSAVAEANAAEFDCKSRRPIILRFGNLLGDDPRTRWWLAQARAGRPIGIGDPQGWAHVIHPEDAGTAVVAALDAPGGVFNVGADPVRRDEMNQVFAEAVGRSELGFMPKLVVKVGGERLAPWTRSHRISSAKLHEATGWKPVHDVFDTSWLSVAEMT